MYVYFDMKKEVVPVCKIEIVDKAKVNLAKKAIKNENLIMNTAAMFKLLGDPTRLKIILALIKSELCVCDLSAAIDSTISAVSHQLRLLRNARLVKYRKEGKMVYYSIEDQHIGELISVAQEHLQEND